MQLSLIIAVLLALTASEVTPEAPAGAPWTRLAAVLLAGAAVAAAARLGARRLCRQLVLRPDLAPRWGRSYRRLQRAHAAMWITLVAASLYGAAWPQVVRHDWQWQDVPLADETLLLAPLLLPLVASWAAFYAFEHAVERLVAARQGRPRPAPAVWRHLSLQCRHHLGLLLAPLLAVLAVQDVIVSTMSEQVVRQYGWAAHLLLLLAMLAAMPWWLKRMWQASPLPDGPLRRRLIETAARARLRLRDLLVWSTDQQVANAAVAGLLPRLRYVYLSDRLLTLLDDDELEAVVLHEAAHIRRRHLLLRMLMLALPLTAWAAAAAAWPQGPLAVSRWLERAGVAAGWQTGLLLPLAAAAYAAAALGLVARLLEYDADLWAARRQGSDGAAMISALGKLARLSPEAARASWMHPSLLSRIAFLRSAARHPRHARHFQRRLAVAGAVLAAAVGMLLLTALAAPPS